MQIDIILLVYIKNIGLGFYSAQTLKLFIMKTYSLLFNQNRNEFAATIKSNGNINEIAGTLINKVLKFFKLVKKYKASTGFNFSRKFTVSLVVDGQQLKQINDIFINGESFEFKLTLMNNETSFVKFTQVMGELCFDLLTTLGEDEVLTIDELINQN